jgi:hypothetical protein
MCRFRRSTVQAQTKTRSRNRRPRVARGVMRNCPPSPSAARGSCVHLSRASVRLALSRDCVALASPSGVRQQSALTCKRVRWLALAGSGPRVLDWHHLADRSTGSPAIRSSLLRLRAQEMGSAAGRTHHGRHHRLLPGTHGPHRSRVLECVDRSRCCAEPWGRAVHTLPQLRQGSHRPFSAGFPVWAWANLIFTCTAEEALFRGVIQRRLQGTPRVPVRQRRGRSPVC